MLVPNVGLSLTNLIHRNRLEGNRLQIFPLELNVGDHAFPDYGLVALYIRRRHIKDEIAEIVKDGPIVKYLHSVYQWRAMHHADIRARLDFLVPPLVEH